ncbi:amino acid ABC transporter permease [Erysipelothrix larvae]|uniref:Amino acid ABC transporter permease n=1 Tax=Erysipelothrix larvae TaxID=1514105 RepID=A0A109UGQ4_9FIRM|nr:amino acid ABC transporter permease [Erysipelothrix larvae]AMC92913.1 amino acid ABC transporter permease [Erysipelothrix larvae]
MFGFLSLDNFYRAFIAEERWKLYLDGLKTTLLISLVACLLGILIGLIIAVIKYSYQQAQANGRVGIVLKVFNSAANIYTTVIRGTPVLLQLLILFTVAFQGLNAAFIGFGINSGAYVSEIIRGGLQSVDSGQSEAGRSLGLSSMQTMTMIVIPQAFKNIVPSLFNELIAMVKETSVAGSIAVTDLTKASQGIQSRLYLIEPLYIVAIIYLILVFTLTQIQKVLERRLARSDRN